MNKGKYMMDTMNQLKHAISKLSEQEAKALLNLIFIRSDLKNDDHLSFIQSIKRTLIKGLEEKEEIKNPETVHIIFGDSSGGSLKRALKDTPYEKNDTIILVPDNFSVGPLKGIYTVDGFNERVQWFEKNFRMDLEDFSWYEKGMRSAFERIQSIKPNQKIIIWTCENASEQTGLRLVMNLLQGKGNEIFELNTYKAFHEFYHYPQLEDEKFPRSTGECTHEQLRLFYEQLELQPLKLQKCQALADEGRNLLFSDSILRSWHLGEVWESASDRDDSFIIETMKRLHKERGNYDFIKAARLIGEVVGYMDQCTSDAWIEYRLRHLIHKGVFKYRGELRAMRMYEVKLNEQYLD